MKSFFNTISAPEQLAFQFEKAAKSQEELVLEVFCHVRTPLAWFQVQAFLPDMIEISVKRAITNLKNDGKLIKTNEQVMGKYGKVNYKYARK